MSAKMKWCTGSRGCGHLEVLMECQFWFLSNHHQAVLLRQSLNSKMSSVQNPGWLMIIWNIMELYYPIYGGLLMIIWNYTTLYIPGIIVFQSMDSMHPTPMLLFHFLLHFLHLRSAGQKRRGLYFFPRAAKGSGIAAAVFVAGAEGSARTASDICCVVDVPVAQQLTKSDDVTTRFLWHPANFEPLSVWKSSRAMNLVFMSPKKLNHQWSILVFPAFNEHSIPIGSMYGIYANKKGVYWWDPCYHIYNNIYIYSSTMDPSWDSKIHWFLLISPLNSTCELAQVRLHEQRRFAPGRGWHHVGAQPGAQLGLSPRWVDGYQPYTTHKHG